MKGIEYTGLELVDGPIVVVKKILMIYIFLNFLKVLYLMESLRLLKLNV